MYKIAIELYICKILQRKLKNAFMVCTLKKVFPYLGFANLVAFYTSVF